MAAKLTLYRNGGLLQIRLVVSSNGSLITIMMCCRAGRLSANCPLLNSSLTDLSLTGNWQHLGTPGSSLSLAGDMLDANQITLVVHALHHVLNGGGDDGEESGDELEQAKM